MKFPREHEEVVDALRALGDPKLGAAVREDRGSTLAYVGVRAPVLRKRVRQGFTFDDRTESERLRVWDDLWQHSPYGEVLFAALEAYRAEIPRGLPRSLWPVVKRWIGRVDNWAHADDLARIYSHLLETYPQQVLPSIERWNRSRDVWKRRISVVSLIHYSGKNAVFLPPGAVLPLVANCVDDEREIVQKAIGWVLREMDRVYPADVESFLGEHGARLSAPAFARAIERRSPEARARLRRRAKR
ncbi:MAG: DNA alkylation repair protein [Planctomycetes bacterium]|nr:DNA alkylation repair protein [Planctomycetota bacterium]